MEVLFCFVVSGDFFLFPEKSSQSIQHKYFCKEEKKDQGNKGNSHRLKKLIVFNIAFSLVLFFVILGNFAL